MYLKVTQRGSIAAQNGGPLVGPGTRLSKADCIKHFGSEKEVDRLVGQGYLVRMYDETDPDAHPLPPQTDVVQQTHPHPQEIDMSKGGKPMTTEPKGRMATLQPTVTVGTGPWDLDPETLIGKDVNELNVMVAERAQQVIDPFETVEEAAAWLSQDFHKKADAEPEAAEAMVATD